MSDPAVVVAWRKRIRQHLADIELAAMEDEDPIPYDLNEMLDDVTLDTLVERLADERLLIAPPPDGPYLAAAGAGTPTEPRCDVYVRISDSPVCSTRQIVDDTVFFDLAADETVVGVEVLGAHEVKIDGVPAAVAARTPQPDQSGTLLAAWRQIETLTGREMCSPASVVDAVAFLVEQHDGAVPQPVVPDGSTVWCDDMSGPNGVGGGCVMPPSHPHIDGIGGQWPAVPDGDDVPARLNAAADALSAAVPTSCAGGNLRGIAVALRLMTPEVRAAVAAALARPTGEQQ